MTTVAPAAASLPAAGVDPVTVPHPWTRTLNPARCSSLAAERRSCPVTSGTACEVESAGGPAVESGQATVVVLPVASASACRPLLPAACCLPGASGTSRCAMLDRSNATDGVASAASMMSRVTGAALVPPK